MQNYKWIKHIFKEPFVCDNGKSTTIQTVTICLQDISSGRFLISPFSSFILEEFGCKKTSSQIAAANVVVAFLNYIYFFLEKTIYCVTPQDAVDFIDAKFVKRNTKDAYANTLTKFFLFLHKSNMIIIPNNIPLEKFHITGYMYAPVQRKQDVIHNIKTEYLPLFLQCAKDVAPDIVLGIFIQIFGGLRCSEVVSLEYSDIAISSKDSNIRTMFINLRDKDLRPDLPNAFTAKVKVNRRQEIIPAFGTMLFDLYESHRTSYKRTDTLAIFIDANGKPMTSKTYARKFQKVKKEFIKRLSESEDISTQSYAIYLSTYKWSTHICRGVFSNLIADNSNNVSEIAAWRGDKSLVSSLTYLNDNQVVAEKTLKTLNKLYEGENK